MVIATTAPVIAEALETLFHEIGDTPPNVRLMREETASFALTYCTLITLLSLKGATQEIQRRVDEMNTVAVDEFVKRGWVETRSELLKKLKERYPEYSMEIKYEIFQTEGKNEHGGASFAFATVFKNAYESTGIPNTVMLATRSFPLVITLRESEKHIRKVCAENGT